MWLIPQKFAKYQSDNSFKKMSMKKICYQFIVCCQLKRCTFRYFCLLSLFCLKILKRKTSNPDFVKVLSWKKIKYFSDVCCFVLVLRICSNIISEAFKVLKENCLLVFPLKTYLIKLKLFPNMYFLI